jgi:hypothetical protein
MKTTELWLVTEGAAVVADTVVATKHNSMCLCTKWKLFIMYRIH